MSLVGAEPLTSFDEDTSKAAKHCRILLPRLRDTLNAGYRWNFAMTRKDLGGADATAPTWGFDNSYTLPGDLLRLWETDIDDPGDYRVEGRKLLADASSVNILYARVVTTVNDMTTGFRAVLEHLLAAALAIPVIRKPSLRSTYLDNAKELLLDAIPPETQENKPRIPPGDALLVARLPEPFVELDV